MYASVLRYSESVPPSGNVTKSRTTAENMVTPRPTGRAPWISPVTVPIHHRAEDGEHGRRDAQDGGLPRPRGGRRLRRSGVRPGRRVRARDGDAAQRPGRRGARARPAAAAHPTAQPAPAAAGRAPE